MPKYGDKAQSIIEKMLEEHRQKTSREETGEDQHKPEDDPGR